MNCCLTTQLNLELKRTAVLKIMTSCTDIIVRNHRQTSSETICGLALYHCLKIYRITSILKDETDIITSIAVSLIGCAVIILNMYV